MTTILSQLTDKIEAEIGRVNHQLDALRALAYANGVAPIFADDAPRAGPWDRREELVPSLHEAITRLGELQTKRILGEPLRQRCEWLYNEARYQLNALHEAGFLTQTERYDEGAVKQLSYQQVIDYYAAQPAATVHAEEATVSTHARITQRS